MSKYLAIAAFLLFLSSTSTANAQSAANPWWFDFGITKSPLAENFTRVLPTARWGRNQTIGWKRRPFGYGLASPDPLSDYHVLDSGHAVCLASNLLPPTSASIPAYNLTFQLSGLRPPARLRGESFLVGYQDLPPVRGRRSKPLILFGIPLTQLARGTSPATFTSRTVQVQNFFGRPTCFLVSGPVRRIALHALSVSPQSPPPTPTPSASPSATPSSSQTPTPQPSGTPTPGSASAPTALSAKAVSSTEVTLFWTASNNSGIRVERDEDNQGQFQTVLDLPGNSNAYTDVSVFANHSYTYQVRALDQQGNASDPSNQKTVTTPQAGPSNLDVVTNLSFVPTSVNSGTLSWNDPNTSDGSRQNIVERSDNRGLLYRVVALVGTENSFSDSQLTPGSSYTYRVMVGSNGGDFNTYSQPLTVNIPARAAGKPVEPSETSALSQIGGKVFLTWKNNDPNTPQFSIERALYDPWHPMTYSVIATTSAGATSYTDSGLSPETPYAYRIRAKNGLGFSGYDKETPVATASSGTGSPKNYHVGPGQTYPNIGDLDWTLVGPGDTVSIHYKPGGYHEILQIAQRGTEAAWITVTGVPDPVTGALPSIDGTDAVLDPQFANHYAPLSGSGVLVIGTRPNYLAGYKPGYLVVQNFEIKNAYSANSFTDFDGSVKQYGDVGAGIYIERGDHITIRNNSIHDNGEGIFGAGQSGFDRLMTDLLIQGNDLHGNGNVGRYLEHQSYLEAVNVTYEFNHYGYLRDGAGGANIKDRSVNTIIRFNRIEGGAHQLQLPESENQVALALTLPSYRLLRAYGNTIYNPPGDGSSPVLYGSDHGNLPFYRKGILSFAYNTVITQSDQTGPSGVYKVDIFELQGAGQILDARNNIILGLPEHPGSNPSDLGIIGGFDSAYFGRNWFSPHWTASIGNGYNFQGEIYGSENIITNSANNPGFVDVSSLDFHLASGSQCLDQGLPGAEGAWSLTSQYREPNSSQSRTVNGAAPDLGAYER